VSGYPISVTLSEPGHRTVIARRGSFFDPLPPRPMNQGELTTLVIESDTHCNSRSSGGPPGPIYHHARVRLNDGVVRANTRGARGIDVGCGAFVSKFGRWLGAS
jgi:hypothetical protein